MHRSSLFPIRLALIIATLCVAASAQNILIGLEGGGSKTSGSGVDNLRLGYTLAADGALRLHPYVQLGLRYGFTDWAPAIDAFSQAISDSLSFVNVTGSTWSMEVVPFLRATTAFPDNVVNLFAQAAMGVYIINSDITVDATTTGGPVSQDFGTGTDAHLGFAFGGGMTIGEATPVQARFSTLYNYVVRDETPDQYFTFTAGMVFGIGW